MIVGASLAGLTAAETLRAEGFTGSLTVIGDEPYLPYDRPPLSKEVLTGWVPAEHTQLPRHETLAGVEWRLGVAATGLDLAAKHVRLADGHTVLYDRLLIATGTRARPWPNPNEAKLEGDLHPARTRRCSAPAGAPGRHTTAGCWSSGAGSPDRRLPPTAASSACRSR